MLILLSPPHVDKDSEGQRSHYKRLEEAKVRTQVCQPDLKSVFIITNTASRAEGRAEGMGKKYKFQVYRI